MVGDWIGVSAQQQRGGPEAKAFVSLGLSSLTVMGEGSGYTQDLNTIQGYGPIPGNKTRLHRHLKKYAALAAQGLGFIEVRSTG